MEIYDVLLFSDFRLPGGTNKSNAQELRVHRMHGIKTGLVQCNSRLSAKPRAWDEAILNELEAGLVEPVKLAEPTRAKVAILRHPVALETMPNVSGLISVDHAIIVANQPAVRGDGEVEYDPAAISAIVADRLGTVPAWGPIGPTVRESLARWSDEISIRSENWTNIFAAGSDPQPRKGFMIERPRIGRHSRPQASKWPSTEEEIRQAYPNTPDYEVSILGGADPAFELLGGRPTRWSVTPFGGADPFEFLKGVDFWVYFHHPHWIEAYGRSIMEALWSGAVVILPEYLQATYGDAAIYAAPKDVRGLIREFQTGERDYLEQSRAGQAFAAAHSPAVHRNRMVALLEGDPADFPADVRVSGRPSRILTPSAVDISTTRPSPTTRLVVDERPRALFITSNGAGMGHLTRMLGIARAVSDCVEPIFFSMSQGVGVVASAGFGYEYLPFNSALQTTSALWHRYLAERLRAAIRNYGIEMIVFDGTWPYRGMLEVFPEADLLKVWVRRGLWKPDIRKIQLGVSKQFDLIIEPGDYASEYDGGATRNRTDAYRVGPMTILEPHEILSHDDAVRELGLPEDGRRFALVTLGAGNINDVSSAQGEFLKAIAREPNMDAVVTKPPIAVGRGVVSEWSVSTFPLARFMNAFDYAVSAAGYNSFSEWMAGGLPTIWVPNMETMTDDQDARARWAADHGMGLRVTSDDSESIHAAVRQISDPSVRSEMRGLLATLPPADGVKAAAAQIQRLVNRRIGQRGK